VTRAALAYRLVPPGRPARGRAGDRPGAGAGSSLEFMDFRGYQPGDDLRRVDWRGFARTDQLQIRLYREEIAPFVDVVVDASESMAATPAKARAARELAGAFVLWARRADGAARCLASGGAELADARLVRFAGPDTVRPAAPLRPRGWRVWITDGLWDEDPAARVRELALGAAHVDLVQLLDPWERAPEPAGDIRLVDAETRRELELALDAGAVARYRERLDRLEGALRRAVRAVRGRFAAVTAGPLDAMAGADLVPPGLLEPAS